MNVYVQDLDMYDESTDTPALARNSNLNEELGQVYTYVCTYIIDWAQLRGSSWTNCGSIKSIMDVHQT